MNNELLERIASALLKGGFYERVRTMKHNMGIFIFRT